MYVLRKAFSEEDLACEFGSCEQGEKGAEVQGVRAALEHVRSCERAGKKKRPKVHAVA